MSFILHPLENSVAYVIKFQTVCGEGCPVGETDKRVLVNLPTMKMEKYLVLSPRPRPIFGSPAPVDGNKEGQRSSRIYHQQRPKANLQPTKTGGVVARQPFAV